MAELIHSKDTPWMMRTYSGYANAKETNQLYRTNLAKGQTGLSVAFDLPTQTGLDSDHPLAMGEVGKLGVPVRNYEDMEILFDQIPIEKMNTSMTINAPTPWLLALYLNTAKKQGANISQLRGTTQNDILKEYLSRGTYIFPPKPSIQLSANVISFTVNQIPKWNPINICSYHLQEAGANPVQEVAFALSNAITVLDKVRESGEVKKEDFPKVVGRISFFLNAGIRFVEEMCKFRVFAKSWDRICRERYGIEEPKFRRFRYGMQPNSLNLTVQQPENNIARILYEFLGSVLSKESRARSVQLPAWNEALGLPRKWDQQWSLRMQQILAYETDLLEYEDIFSGSKVIAKKEKELEEAVEAELDRILQMGGYLEAIESGYVKRSLVESNAKRLRSVESGEQIVVGVNEFTETEKSPLIDKESQAFLTVDQEVENEQISILQDFRKKRDNDKVAFALERLRKSAEKGENIMESSLECAEVGVTTGEWANVLREVFGEYRPATGVKDVALEELDRTGLEKIQAKVKEVREKLGSNIKILIGKPGLDGHSNGAEQIALKAKEAGMDVVYEGIRLTPTRIAESALEEGVHIVGLSILSGSHSVLIPEVMKEMRKRELNDVPVILGGIISKNDIEILLEEGVKRVYTQRDYNLNSIMSEIVDIAKETLKL